MLDKKMREKWKRAVLLLGCMVLVFSGCGKTGDVKESGAVESQTAAEQAEEVTETTEVSETIFQIPENYSVVITVKINPELRIYLDENANVLAVEPVNEDAQKLIAAMQLEGMTFETCMEKMIAHAHEMGYLKEDGTIQVTAEGDEEEFCSKMTEEQEQALLSFIKTDNVYHKHYDDVLILLKTGLRISELCGLTVADIDFKNEVVIIDHQLLKSKEQGYYIETPKTKSGIRQVPLSRETIQAFQRVMKKRPKAEPFVIDGRSNFLFVNHKGKPKVAIDYNALFIRMVKKYNKHHKDNPLPHITPHTLRHTFCTRLANKNMNPKDLQYIMGHSNISITMNWYAHASIDTAKSEVQRLIA